jgi:ankyrin repeat protein
MHDNNGNTPLHFAASEGHLEVARMLLELGADVNSQNDEGLTPLQRASQVQREGESGIMRLLLDYGANVNVHDKRRNTPLHFAASEGHLEVARMLLELGADINSQNDKGLTPLQRASQVPHREMHLLKVRHYATLARLWREHVNIIR